VKTVTALAANKLGKFFAKDFRHVFGPAHDELAQRLGSLARSTIECLARSDALYHNFERHGRRRRRVNYRWCNLNSTLRSHETMLSRRLHLVEVAQYHLMV